MWLRVDLMKFDAYRFWDSVDALRGSEPLTRLCSRIGVNYARVKRNRTDCRLPSLEDACLFAFGLSTSVESLLLGTEDETGMDDEVDAVRRDPRYRTLVRYSMRDEDLLNLLLGIIRKTGVGI